MNKKQIARELMQGRKKWLGIVELTKAVMAESEKAGHKVTTIHDGTISRYMREFKCYQRVKSHNTNLYKLRA